MSETNLRVIRLVTIVVLAPPWSLAALTEQLKKHILHYVGSTTHQHCSGVGKFRPKWGGPAIQWDFLANVQARMYRTLFGDLDFTSGRREENVGLLYFVHLYLGHR